MTHELDMARVRSAFPGLAGEWILMDNAGGSQCLASVAARIGDYLLNCNVQHGASYEPSVRAGARLAGATEELREWLGAGRASEVVFGASTTQLLANIARSFGLRLQPGDEVVVTDVDHEANIGAWLALRDRGVVVRTWPIHRESLQLRTEELEHVIGPRTRLVCFTAASNVLGTLHPIADFVRYIHEHGALACVDAVALAPHRLPDVRGWDVDLLAFSAYKTYGPHVGVLYGRRSVLLELPGINHFFIGPEDVPYKLQPGNANFELADGAGAVVAYLEDLGVAGPSRRERLIDAFDAIARQEERLSERLLAYLNGRSDVTIWGSRSFDRRERVPTISFTVAGRLSESITRHLDTRRIGARHGNFYARRLLDRIGLDPDDGVVRVSLVHYNTLDEVDRLIAGLDELR